MGESNVGVHAVLRDAKCHETVMWWVHHIPDVVKHALRDKITLPLLPQAKTNVALLDEVDSHSAQIAMATLKHATNCMGCHINSPANSAFNQMPTSTPQPRPWPSQFEMTTNITGGTFGSKLVQRTEYRYQHM